MVASPAVSDEARKDTRPLAAAIYGAVQATALVAAFSEDEHLSSLELPAWLAITVLVFWLAHAYAAILAEGYAARRSLARVEALAARRREGLTGMRLLTSALITAAFGAAVVSMKAALG